MFLSLNTLISFVGIVLLICILLNRVSAKAGVPTLILFIGLGLAFTHPSLIGIPFDNYDLAEKICSVCLIFIMFYGGFGTRWEEARHIYRESVVLASVGVFLTALTVAGFAYYALGFSFTESFLLGAVISSTDAASVFSIIRSKKLSLRYRTSSLLELESGSNDPFSYMLTVTGITMLTTTLSTTDTFVTVVVQVGVAIIAGLTLSFLAIAFLNKFRPASGFDTVFIFSVALLAYSIPSTLGGNGYLSAYIVGIIIGNSQIENKIELVNFFDGITNIMQMILFFLLGLLATPSKIVDNLPIAFAVFMFLTFVGRPLVVELLMIPFKTKFNQRLVISWAGLRGAASIVFAILVMGSRSLLKSDIFHIVFGIVLFSILLQGSLLPILARRLGMTDPFEDPLKTFNDYSEEKPIEFISLHVDEDHIWAGSRLKDIPLHKDLLLVLILRGEDRIVPNGNTEILIGDTLVLVARTFDEGAHIALNEMIIEEDSSLTGRSLMEIGEDDKLIVLIKRGDNYIIPAGKDVLQKDDEIIYIKGDTLE